MGFDRAAKTTEVEDGISCVLIALASETPEQDLLSMAATKSIAGDLGSIPAKPSGNNSQAIFDLRLTES